MSQVRLERLDESSRVSTIAYGHGRHTRSNRSLVPALGEPGGANTSATRAKGAGDGGLVPHEIVHPSFKQGQVVEIEYR